VEGLSELVARVATEVARRAVVIVTGLVSVNSSAVTATAQVCGKVNAGIAEEVELTEARVPSAEVLAATQIRVESARNAVEVGTSRRRVADVQGAALSLALAGAAMDKDGG
jgi:hypothetical protein